MKSLAIAPPLPTRDGVSPSCVVLPTGFWPSIADFMCERFPALSAVEWRARIEAGEVVDEFGQVVTMRRPFKAGLRVFYYRSLPEEKPIPFEECVLFQDEYLVIVDKPHFLPVTPGGRYLQETLLVRLKRKLGIASLSPIHRIDRETAGLVVFAVQAQTRGAYQALFAQRKVCKQYEAITPFRVDLGAAFEYGSRLEDSEHFMQMREVPGEPNSITHFELIARHQGLAHYRLSPVTGRRHQLRVHCSALGIPILHDRIYPDLQPEDTDDFERPLQLLAREISFQDPVTGVSRHFVSKRTLLRLEAAENSAASATFEP